MSSPSPLDSRFKHQQPKPSTVLDNIVTRPSMYWGNSANHFHSFLAFLSGATMATSESASEETRRQLKQIIPPHFDEFVSTYFGQVYATNTHGWAAIIEQHARSDREALDLFLKLRHLYDEQEEQRQDDAGDVSGEDKSNGSRNSFH